jgi:O-antigen ligase
MAVLAVLDRMKGSGGGFAAAALLPLAGLHLLLGARGLALFTLVVLVGSIVLPARAAKGHRLSGPRLVVAAGAVLLAGLLLQAAYLRIATAGIIGESERAKASFQSGQYGLIVGGRKDAVFLVAAIVHAPLLGVGPDATASTQVKADAAEWLVDHGYRMDAYDNQRLVAPDQLYLHSVILEAWVTGGVLAVPFWVLTGALIMRATARALARRALAESYLLVVAVWHLGFSPLGDVTRAHLAVAAALSLTAATRSSPGRSAPAGSIAQSPPAPLPG